MKQNNNDSKVESLFLGLLLPVIGAISALRKPKSGSFVLLFSLFYGFLGAATYFSYNGGTDVVRSAISFIDACNKDMSFFEYFNSLPTANQIDYFTPFMTWLCSRITSNVHIYFWILAFINGLFIGYNVTYIAQKAIINKATIWLIVLLAFVSNPMFIFHRWWMALNVFLFGTIRYLLERKKTYLLIAGLSILIHFSFIFPLLIVIVIPFLPSNLNLLFLIVYVAFSFVDTLDLSFVSNMIAPYMPDSYVSRTELYIEFEHAEHNFLSRSTQLFFKILNVILSIAIYISTKKEKDYPLIKYFNVCLVIGIFSAITNTTEQGWRYFDITNFLFVSLYILTISYFDKTTRWNNIRLALPFFIYIIIYQIRSILDGIGPSSLLFGNYFTVWFIDDNTSVLNLIKRLI